MLIAGKYDLYLTGYAERKTAAQTTTLGISKLQASIMEKARRITWE